MDYYKFLFVLVNSLSCIFLGICYVTCYLSSPSFKKLIYLAEPGLSSHLWDLVP